MKISEVDLNTIKAYCRVETTVEDDIFTAIREAAVQFIQSQTGMDAAQCDEKEDLTIALLMLCADLYDNRNYTNFSSKEMQVNPAAKAIIDQYCLHLL